MWSVSASVPMGGSPKALPTPAMAGSSSVCVNLPVWLLFSIANLSFTNFDHVWSFSTNCFKDFPSIMVAILAYYNWTCMHSNTGAVNVPKAGTKVRSRMNYSHKLSIFTCTYAQ